MRDEFRSFEGDGLLRVRHRLVTFQVVIRPVVDAIESSGSPTANVAGSKKIWSSAWRNSRIRYAPWRGLISFRYARPTIASPIGSFRRNASNSRLKFR